MNDYKQTQSPGMAIASLVLGILSLLLVCCGVSFFLGALGMLLALLSRGRSEMTTSAKAGMGLSLAGMILGLITFVFTLMFSSAAEVYTDYYDEIGDFLEEYEGGYYSDDIPSYDYSPYDGLNGSDDSQGFIREFPGYGSSYSEHPHHDSL